MDILHHQPTQREEDGLIVCARCGLVNPQDGQPCIAPNAEPTDPDTTS